MQSVASSLDTRTHPAHTLRMRWWTLTLCSGVLACSSTPSAPNPNDAPAAPAAPAAQAAARVIGKLQTRDETLIMTSTAEGVRFGVTRNDGQVVLQGGDEAELRRAHPELFGLFKNATAKSFVDARLDVRPKPPDVGTPR
ncbi:MAG: hypothetical protein H6717_18410 [Polyangiaceae bacterium]|nr:hypothetical protein [Polyangiaceae bacterium]